MKIATACVGTRKRWRGAHVLTELTPEMAMADISVQSVQFIGFSLLGIIFLVWYGMVDVCDGYLAAEAFFDHYIICW